jgi:hypothetical protein
MVEAAKKSVGFAGCSDSNQQEVRAIRFGIALEHFGADHGVWTGEKKRLTP